MTDASKTETKRPLEFTRWLRSRGMNPSRQRPVGRQTVLWMEYRDYLSRTVGSEKAAAWFDKRAARAAGATKDNED